MFTVEELEQAKLSGIEKSVLFSMSKNPVSYEISLMNNKDKGQRIEWMMYRRFLYHGFNVEYVGGRYDLLLNNSIRVEIKCATARHESGNYVIQKMKPEYFDIVFMVFIAPDKQEIKWSTQKDVNNWSSERARGVEGYSIVFNSDIESSSLKYKNGFDSFLEEYSWQNELVS
jgi:hypothetical protein